jgi:hypothetical protein
MYQDCMLDWVDWVWDLYNKGSRHGGRDTCLLMDECSVHLMLSVCNRMNKCGSEVEFITSSNNTYEIIHAS